MSSTKTQTSKMPSWQREFLQSQVLPTASRIANEDFVRYEGDMIAGMTPTQQQALSGFAGLDMGGQAYRQALDVQRGLTDFGAAGMGAEGAVSAAQAPGQIGVNQLATMDFDAYMSPYTQNVINRSLDTLRSAEDMALNRVGAQAEAAGAFGGSRQGVEAAQTREAYAKQAADLVSGLQEKAFTQALQSGQFDIANVQRARELEAGQQMTASTLNQQAQEAAAARAQAARAADFQGQFQTAGIQSGAANAMAGLAGQQLQSQLSGLGAQMSAGEQQRAIEQAQLAADFAAFQAEQAYPLTQLNALMGAAGAIPTGLGTTYSKDPFGGLTAAGQFMEGVGSLGQGFGGGGGAPSG